MIVWVYYIYLYNKDNRYDMCMILCYVGTLVCMTSMKICCIHTGIAVFCMPTSTYHLFLCVATQGFDFHFVCLSLSLRIVLCS